MMIRGPEQDARARGLRRWSLSVAAILTAEAAVIVVVLAASGRQVLLPVEAFLSAPSGRASADRVTVQIAAVDLGAAIVVLCLLVALFLVVTGWRPAASSGRAGSNMVSSGRSGSHTASSGRAGSYTTGSDTPGSHTARWTQYSLTSSITVFLVAQLNGITDATTLVLVYAATTGAALFGLLSGRTRVTAGHPRLALCFEAGLGIVPWGVIAFQQVGAGLAGLPPTAAVTGITLLMLAFAAAFVVAEWRTDNARVHLVLTGASTFVFSATVLVWVILPG